MYRTSLAALAVAALLTGCASPNAMQEEAPKAAEGAPTLTARVGSEESASAFEISLTDENGDVVTELPAGKYNIEVIDQTDIHNFHLQMLDGELDEKTGVREKADTLWVVTLEAGEYRYLCDPHPSMKGTFTVV